MAEPVTTPPAPRYPNMMWLAAITALLCLLAATWLPSLRNVLGILGFIALYVVVRRATESDKAAMTVFIVGVVALIVVPLVYRQFTAVQQANQRAQIINDILYAEKIDVPGSLGISALYDYCQKIEDATGWFISNQLKESADELSQTLKKGVGTSADLIDRLEEEEKKRNALLPALSKIQKVRTNCTKSIRLLAETDAKAVVGGKWLSRLPTTPATWWIIGFPLLVFGWLLIKKGVTATQKTIGVVMLVGLATAIGYAIIPMIATAIETFDATEVGKTAGALTLLLAALTSLLASEITVTAIIAIITLLFIWGIAFRTVKEEKRHWLSTLGGILILLAITVTVILYFANYGEILATPKPQWTFCADQLCTKNVKVHAFTSDNVHLTAHFPKVTQVFRWEKGAGFWYTESGTRVASDRDLRHFALSSIDAKNQCAVGSSGGQKGTSSHVKTAIKIWQGDKENCPLF